MKPRFALLFVFLLTLGSALWLGRAESRAAGSTNQPNVIVIMVDDQELRSFNSTIMPETFRTLAGSKGAHIVNALAAPPLCCPARAGFQTGQYPHNHGVVANNYALLEDKDNVLPAWLMRAGYKTAFIGKYMNEYEQFAGKAPAPGFGFWWSLYDKPGYFEYDVNANGTILHKGSTRADYSTTAITDKTVQYIQDNANGVKPFFIWTSYYAPHNRTTLGSDITACNNEAPLPLQADWNRFKDTPVAKPANYNEADVSDKPLFIRQTPQFDANTSFKIDQRFRCTLAAMQEVDRSVQRINQTIRESGLDNNTVVIYMSDNGYFFGNHRLVKGKAEPYEEALRVPMLIRVPAPVLGSTGVSQVNQLVSTVDVAPTILDLANAPAQNSLGESRVMDGKSVVPLLKGDTSTWPQDRGVLAELGNECTGFAAVRTFNHTYVERRGPLPGGGCGTTERELYALSSDPFQLNNLSASRPDLAWPLSLRLHALETCSGSTCE